jgi:hypothetical protein
MRLIELLWVAAKGNPNAPVELIDYFGECIDGLREVKKAPEIAKALNLTKPRHRAPEPDKWLRKGVLAIAVEDMRKQGKTLEDVIAKVAKEYQVSESTVKQAYLSSELLKR